MQPARSFVIVPLSTVSTQTLSRVSANLVREGKAEGESRAPLGLGRGFPPPTAAPQEGSGLLLLDQLWVAVQLASMLQASGPGEDAGNGVGASGTALREKCKQRAWALGTVAAWPPTSVLPRTSPPSRQTHLLVLPEVASHRAVSSLCFDGFSIRTDENRGHKTQGAKPLGQTQTSVRQGPSDQEGGGPCSLCPPASRNPAQLPRGTQGIAGAVVNAARASCVKSPLPPGSWKVHS